MIRSISFCLFLCSIVTLFSQENRSITGVGNNPNNPEWGATHAPLLRISSVNYADDMQAMNDADLPLPRVISNKLFDQQGDFLEAQQLSDFVWAFGQFIDHDISLTETDPFQAPTLLEIPENDDFFEVDEKIFLSRSKFEPNTGTAPGNPRQFANEVSSFLDASVIYGSDIERSSWLRSYEGGKMKVSLDPSQQYELLPWNTTTGAFNDPVDYSNAPLMADDTRSLDRYFVAGDVRANENPLLICLHTIFVREHNRLCNELASEYPTWDDEQLYQRARKMVGAYIQAITYFEWLPSLGVHLTPYQGYIPTTDPSIFNVFSAAAFRFGHTMIDSDIILMDDDGGMVSTLGIKDVFFRPKEFVLAGGVEPFLKGMGTQIMQEMDCKMVGDLRNFLFGEPGRGGLDLASINIFRGRDRGLADYNTLRDDFQLPPINSFDDITDSQNDIRILEELYGDVNNIDAWVGMLSEKHIDDNSVFGELVMRIVKEQFRRLREGDRFYFENDEALTQAEKFEIKNTTLHDIIMRNTSISLMQPDVFRAMPHEEIFNPTVEEITLSAIAFPNPLRESAVVRIYSDQEQLGSYKLINSTGQLLHIGEMTLEAGNNNFIDLDLGPKYPRGVYHLLLETQRNYSITKLIKQ